MDKPSSSLKNEQPKIISDSWGKITVGLNGQSQTFKDAVLLPGKAIAWDWNWNVNEGIMHHKPGIREIDLDHFILSQDPKPDVVILSRGRGLNPDNSLPGELNVDSRLEAYLKILKTAESIKKYEEICKNSGVRVAALIHTTC
jgi:hypothetical protein